MRSRKNSDSHIFLDADTYQAAILNLKLPNGIRLMEEDHVHKMIQNAKKKYLASKKRQELEEKKD